MMEIELPRVDLKESKGFPLAHKIRKNYLQLKRWAEQSATNCFRLYDREISSYPVAIDYYAGRYCVHYFSRKRGFEEPPPELLEAIETALHMVFGASKDLIYYRFRLKQKDTRQYEKIADMKAFFSVLEYGVAFRVNLTDYLDTGLFLDHRETRRFVSSLARGKRLLNLFAYTSSFSVHAAIQGAVFTKSVDMSHTYCAWGRENFQLNGIAAGSHPIIRDDCLKFIDREIASDMKYDLIVIDPPTISRSKKMDQLFDIQVDHVPLLTKALKLLAKDGVLIFSCNARKFVFDPTCFWPYSVVEISEKTIPLDFQDRHIHRCWKFQADKEDCARKR